MHTLLNWVLAVMLTVGSGFAAAQQWYAPALAAGGQRIETVMTTPPSSYAHSISANGTAFSVHSPLPTNPGVAADDNAIRPFRVDVPEETLVELRLRLGATRWPDRETVTDRSQGAQLANLQELVADPAQSPTKDDVLDNITLYWLTNSASSAGRLYWESGGRSAIQAAAWMTDEISLPVAITVFPEDVYRAPETWARRAYRNLIYFNEVDRGGHFAAWEEPELFAAEVQAAFRSLR